MPRPWRSSATAKETSAFRVPKPVVGRDRDHTLGTVTRKCPDQRAAFVPVRLEDGLDEAGVTAEHPLEARVGLAGERALEEPRGARPSAAAGGQAAACSRP